MIKMMRSAAPVLTTLLSAIAIGCSGEPEVVEKIVVKEVPVEVVVTATPVPTVDSSKVAVAETTVEPTIVAEPTATPTRVSEDYYVIIKGRTIEYWADFPSKNDYGSRTGGSFALLRNHDLFWMIC